MPRSGLLEQCQSADMKNCAATLHRGFNSKEVLTMRKISLSIAVIFLFSNLVYSRDLILSAAPSIWARPIDSKLEGPIIEFVTTVFTELGVTIRTKHLPWNRAILYMELGEIDVIVTIFHTAEREKFMEFTIPYVEIPTVVIVPKGKSFPFTKLDDLIGLRGLCPSGASLGETYNHFSNRLNISQIIDEEQIIGMLNIGRADYAIGSKYVFLFKAREIGFEDKIEILSTPITSRGLRMAFSKKSSFLKYLPKVNRKIKQRQEDGTIAEMTEKAKNAIAGK